MLNTPFATAQPASQAEAPLIAECYGNLACRVVDAQLVTQYNFFVLEVVKAWIDPEAMAPRTLHHRGRGEPHGGRADAAVAIPGEVEAAGSFTQRAYR